jgi:hypothetical protein
MLFTVSDAARPVRNTTADQQSERAEVQVSRTAVRTPAASPRGTGNNEPQATTPRVAGQSRSATPRGENQTVSPRANAAGGGVPATTRSAQLSRTGVINSQRTIMQKGQAAHGAQVSRSALGRPVISRAAATTAQVSGAAEYEACRGALFECMDQFCMAKSEEYKRCSCSDTLAALETSRNEMQRAQDKLVDANDNMFVVTLGKSEAAALVRETEGEAASAGKTDTSANKGILDSVLASVAGGAVDASKLKTGAKISLEMTDTAFGANDDATPGIDLAAYNGRQLFNTVFSMCKPMIGDRCKGKGHLDRASAAYDIIVEQDCAAIARALKASGAKLSDAVRGTSVNLSAARIENYDNMNSLSEGECITKLKEAMQEGNACGPGYKFCLDAGKFIDQQTGGILPSAINLNQLRDMITFSVAGDAGTPDQIVLSGDGAALRKIIMQKLDVVSGPILDRCDAVREQVRQRYIDMALAEIHYIHLDKLEEFKGICMSNVRDCYDKFGPSIREIATGGNVKNILNVYLSADAATALGQREMCAMKIYQCDELIGATAVEDYISSVVEHTLDKSCRGLINDCFSTLGGPQYLNFLKPNPARGITYEAGHGKQAILQGFGESPSGEFYNSLCFNVFAQAKPCQELTPNQRAAIFGTFNFNFNKNDQDVMWDMYSIDKQLADSMNSGIAGEVYRMIQVELNKQCEMRGGVFRPLKAPFTNTDTLAIMERLNREAKNLLFDNFGNTKRNASRTVFAWFKDREAKDINPRVDCMITRCQVGINDLECVNSTLEFCEPLQIQGHLINSCSSGSISNDVACVKNIRDCTSFCNPTFTKLPMCPTGAEMCLKEDGSGGLTKSTETDHHDCARAGRYWACALLTNNSTFSQLGFGEKPICDATGATPLYNRSCEFFGLRNLTGTFEENKMFKPFRFRDMIDRSPNVNGNLPVSCYLDYNSSAEKPDICDNHDQIETIKNNSIKKCNCTYATNTNNAFTPPTSQFRQCINTVSRNYYACTNHAECLFNGGSLTGRPSNNPIEEMKDEDWNRNKCANKNEYGFDFSELDIKTATRIGVINAEYNKCIGSCVIDPEKVSCTEKKTCAIDCNDSGNCQESTDCTSTYDCSVHEFICKTNCATIWDFKYASHEREKNDRLATCLNGGSLQSWIHGNTANSILNKNGTVNPSIDNYHQTIQLCQNNLRNLLAKFKEDEDICIRNANNNFWLSTSQCNIQKSVNANLRCPLDWEDIVDIYSWGICECENGVNSNGTCSGGGGSN